MDACTTCGHRRDAERANGPLTDTRILIEMELLTTVDKQQRVDLLCAMAYLKVMSAWNMVDKRHMSAKKVQIRARRSNAEKVVKRITAKARILRQPEVKPWSVDKDTILNKIPNPEPAPKPVEQIALENFLYTLKPKEENP